MQKFTLTVLFIGLLMGSVQGQSKLGLKFSPVFANSRIDLSYDDIANDTLDIENDGTGTKFSLGLIFDYEITETYYFSTGLVYVPKRVAFTVAGENGGSYPNASEEYRLQYLQLPISLKLFTNEVMPDLSIYFQVGGTADIKLHEEPVDEEFTLIEKFNPIDASVLLGSGLEYRAGVSTILFAGISYQRGLINTINTTNPALPDEFTIRNTVVMLDLGIKF